MFLKHGSYLYNLNMVHVRLDGKRLLLYDKRIDKPIITIEFRENVTASFSYGRVIHGLMNGWGCVDVTEKEIIGLMDRVAKLEQTKKNLLPEIPLDKPTMR